MSADWPAELRGVTETVVTTLGPNGRWNVAALGLHADGDRVTARTWGRTRTWRNFRERGAGYVQFTVDPVDFVDAALAVREEDDPILASADAWARVSVTERGAGEESGTEWVEWTLEPRETAVERECVPTINRGHGAVVEATVAASRLNVPGYDRGTLLERLGYHEEVVETCGGPREREAFERLRDHVDARW
ncbi:MAG: DUF447 domain-containing protein [Haloarculaceae archaeon]